MKEEMLLRVAQSIAEHSMKQHSDHAEFALERLIRDDPLAFIGLRVLSMLLHFRRPERGAKRVRFEAG